MSSGLRGPARRHAAPRQAPAAEAEPGAAALALPAGANIESRRVGGEGDERWVLTTYHVVGKQADGSPIDQITLETMILRRTSGLFRIVHMHWSTNDVKFQALSQSSARAKAASAPPGK